MTTAAAPMTAGAAPMAAAGAGRPVLLLRMRLDPDVRLAASDLRAVADDIARIWKDVAPLKVLLPGEQPRLAVDTVTLRLTTSMIADDSRHEGLGWIHFVNDVPEPEISVSVAAADRMSAAGSWHGRSLSTMPPRASQLFIRRAVARAAAHEVGHYLLRSRAHTVRGLMRPAFTVDEIMDARPADVRLDPMVAAQLAARTSAARARPAAGSRPEAPASTPVSGAGVAGGL